MADTIRVLLVSEWYPWPHDPMRGTWVREQAEAIAGHVDLVALVVDASASPALRRRPWAIEEAAEGGFRLLRLRHRRSAIPKLGSVWRQLGMLVALRRLHGAGWFPDIVHARVFSAGFSALPLARLSRVPLIVSEHYTGFPRGALSRWDCAIARFTFRRAAMVCPDSNDLARHLRPLSGSTEVRHMANVFDDETFFPASTEPSGTFVRLINVAALMDKKGHADLLDALVRVREHRRDVRLDIFGDGPLRDQLREHAAALGLSSTVAFHGGRPKQEIAAALRDAHVFVLPSHWENEPHALIEAMGSGLPSVATAVGGVSAMLDPNGGVLVPPRDPAALAEALLDAINRRKTFDRQRIADRARARWGTKAFVDRWLSVYRELT